MLISDAARIMGATLIGKPDGTFGALLTDSRTNFGLDGLFFALPGRHNDGHHYIPALYERGVRAFVVSQEVDWEAYPEASFVQVPDTLQALQALAAHHRQQYHYPVVGITGSNGKTIVKEWLAQLLHEQLRLVRSPKSYNSQLGVPLSVWGMSAQADLALFEAGISTAGEMECLERIIRPDVVVLTNVGEAHQQGFVSREQKIVEKMKLLHHAEAVVYCADHYEVHSMVRSMGVFANKSILGWGHNPEARLHIAQLDQHQGHTRVQLTDGHTKEEYLLQLPFADKASVENALHSFATCVLLHELYPLLGLDLEAIALRTRVLTPVVMRMDLRPGINGCSIINDAYNADVGSLRIALEFLASLGQHQQRTVILSDIEQSGKENWRLYGEVAQLLRDNKVDLLIGIGPHIRSEAARFGCPTVFFDTTEEFLLKWDRNRFAHEAILIKGSRRYGLERISQLLEQKTHLTTLEVNLTALTDNLNLLQSVLHPGTRTMVLVKAFAYGAGLTEVARLAQHQRVNYLGVAFADEGVQLRQAGISMPIIVLNPEPGTFDQLIAHHLEPEIYSMGMLHSFYEAVQRAGEHRYPIHIKLDTGMHRMGFMPQEVPLLIEQLRQYRGLHIDTVFSHLAAADEERHDAFTREQIALFGQLSHQLEEGVGYSIVKHLANSAATERFAEAQFDMVRLGISFYGGQQPGSLALRTVSTLKTTIVQIKDIPAGHTVGYGRKGQVGAGARIAVLPIGYADGLSRLLSNGVAQFVLHGQRVPTLGNICMDTCMVDISHVPMAQVGDEVTIFGEHPTVMELAEKIGTISYELLTHISPRVKRVYYRE